jgi:hypothetical protein
MVRFATATRATSQNGSTGCNPGVHGGRRRSRLGGRRVHVRHQHEPIPGEQDLTSAAGLPDLLLGRAVIVDVPFVPSGHAAPQLRSATCFGHIHIRAQPGFCSALRPDTPRSIRPKRGCTSATMMRHLPGGGTARLLLRRGLVAPVGKVEEDLPACRQDRVTPTVLVVRQAALGDRLVERRHLGPPSDPAPPVGGRPALRHQRDELALRVAPRVPDPAADEDGAGGRQGDEHVFIHGHVVQRTLAASTPRSRSEGRR